MRKYIGRKLNVTFDFDGVLNRLVEGICEKRNIDFNRITNYNIMENDELNRYEKEYICKRLSELDSFKKASMLKEARRLKEIERTGIANVGIHSLSYTDDIAEFKRELIKTKLPWLSEDMVNLEVKGSDCGKSNTENVDILVEDCVDNIIKSKPKKCGILISKPYNDAVKCNIDLKRNNIIVVNGLNDAIDTILKILKTEEMNYRLEATKICPSCSEEATKVIDSRTDRITRRRRECTKCKFRWTTVEISEEDLNYLMNSIN